MKFSLKYTEANCETSFITLVGDNPHKYADPGDTMNFFSLISFEYHGGCRGLRFFKIYTSHDSEQLDDFFDRSLLGISRHYNAWVFEVIFLRIIFA